MQMVNLSKKKQEKKSTVETRSTHLRYDTLKTRTHSYDLFLLNTIEDK